MQTMLGDFLFSINTAAHQKKQRSSKQRWAKNDRVGKAAAHQYLGIGDDEITLPGVIYPELTGATSALSINALRDMADAGIPYLMLSEYAQQGHVLGTWIILSVNETQSYLDGDLPRKIEFNIKLRRYEDTELFDVFNRGVLNAI